MQGDTGGRSDPASLDTDKGPNILDQRHTFVGSIVAQPQFDIEGIGGAILNNNQFGIAILMASGIPVTLRSNRELNNDGIGSDRPVGVTRNSYRLPARHNVDLRYTRLFPVVGATKVEFLAEVKNIFNSVQWAGCGERRADRRERRPDGGDRGARRRRARRGLPARPAATSSGSCSLASG